MATKSKLKLCPEVKTKWVKALRSKKYKQTDGVLKNEDGYCCLGVLCDVYRKDLKLKPHKIWDDEYNFIVKKGKDGGCDEVEDATLPPDVAVWAGLKGPKRSDPTVTYDKRRLSLSQLNDSEGLTFEAIADIIETQL